MANAIEFQDSKGEFMSLAPDLHDQDDTNKNSCKELIKAVFWYIRYNYYYLEDYTDEMDKIEENIDIYYSASQITEDMLAAIQNSGTNTDQEKLDNLKVTITLYWKFYKSNCFKNLLADLWADILNLRSPTIENAQVGTMEMSTEEIVENVEGYPGFDMAQLTTSLSSNCSDKKCQRLETLTNNRCFKNGYECNNKCKCKKSLCKNRQLSKTKNNEFPQRKFIIKDSYGFDNRLPLKILCIIENDQNSQTFIQNTLPKVLNWSERHNNLLPYLQVIVDDSSFSLEEEKIARKLSNAIKALMEEFGSDTVLNEFLIHFKGVGVFNDKMSETISINTLVGEYVGQVYDYSTWLYIEKKLNFPYFYSVELERNEEDDEINFAKRLTFLVYCAFYDELHEEMQKDKDSLNLDLSLLSGNPLWLEMWIQVVARHIKVKSSQDESKSLLKKWKRELIISLNQIKKYLNFVDQNLKPISALSQQEELIYLWGDFEYSIKTILKEIYQDHLQVCYMLSDQTINSANLARNQLLLISDTLKNMEGNTWRHQGVADILILIACTKNFYKLTKYPQVQIKLPITACEIAEEEIHDDDDTILKLDEYYLPLTLIGMHKSDYAFNKQDFEHEMNGTANLAGYLKLQDFDYTAEMRQKFLQKLEESPLRPWKYDEDYIGPALASSVNCTHFGSPMLDCLIDEGSNLKRCLNYLNIN